MILISLRHWLQASAQDDAAFQKRPPALLPDKTKPCLIYCAIGERARLLAAEMVRMGFTDIRLLRGGFNAWVASGKAVAR